MFIKFLLRCHFIVTNRVLRSVVRATISQGLHLNNLLRNMHTGDIMSSDWIIVKTKIKEIVGEYNVASDFPEALNEKVKQMVQDAKKRAEGNNRKTIMGRDL